MPSIISSVSFSTDFKINIPVKKFLFTDLTDYLSPAIPTTGVRGSFKITDPSGTVIYNNTSFGAGSDIIRNVSASNATIIPLPLNSDGTVVRGSYIIVYTVQIIDGSNPAYFVTRTTTYNNQYVAPIVSISQIVDCLSPLFTSDDVTDYTSNGVLPALVRTHTLNYPFGSAGEGTPIVTAGQTITTSTFYNGTQTTEISSILTYTFTDGLIVTDTVTGNKELLVDCQFICSIFCCLRSLYNNRENNRGVNQVEFNKFSALFNEVMSTVELALVAISCGKVAEVEGYLNLIKTIANCTDDCSCNDGTPSLVTGLGGSGVNVVVQSGGAPITVTSMTAGSTTTYTVTLDAAFVNKVNNSYNTVVAAGTNITVSSATVGDTTTYTVNTTGSTYTNATPVPVTIGGISAGSTFLNQTLQQMFDALLYPYQSPAFTSFGISGQTTLLEVGLNSAIALRTFLWTTSNPANVVANSIAIRDVTLGVSPPFPAIGLANDGSESFNFAITSPVGQGSHTWSIEATNTNSILFLTTFTVNWNFRLYYGTSASTPLTEAQIEALAVSSLTTTALGTYNFGAAASQYKYLSFPNTFTQPTLFKDAATNLVVPFTQLSDVSVTNSNGVVQMYSVWRSFNQLGGAITIIVT